MAKIKCENCGAKYNGNFCPICSTPAPEQPQKKKKKWVLPVVIVVVLILLKQGIDVVISQKNIDASCTIYGTDVLGLIQNDPRYASIINDSGDLHNMPQKHLEHKLLTASAAVDGKKVTMLEDNGSANAEAPLTVVNTRGFDLPKTGDHGTWMYSIGGVLLMAVAASAMFFALRKKGSVN